MALFRKLFYRKPPDGLLEISERVYVFDCCLTMDMMEDDEYREYVGGVTGQLQGHFPNASFMVFNFREEENQSLIGSVLSEYDMTVMDYPCQYEGCPLLTMEMIHHFLRSSENWLSLSQQNILLMHSERGGWPVLAFMLASLLLYRKQFSGEQKTLEMVYKQAPRELLKLTSPLNPLPSQLRYLQYVSRRNVGSEWPPLDRALTLDCVILRLIPDFDCEGGCRPIFRIYGQDPFMAADRSSKVLFSTPKRSKAVRHCKQADSELVKIDIHCHIQGDVVLECISLDSDHEREEMMFRVMFNTAFIRSNILMLNRDDIDVFWNSVDQFPKDFRAEIIFSEMGAAGNLVSVDMPHMEEKDGLPVEAFAKVQEIFSNVEWLDPKSDVAVNVFEQIKAANILQESLDSGSPRSPDSQSILESALEKVKERTKLMMSENGVSSPTAYSTEGKQNDTVSHKQSETLNLPMTMVKPRGLQVSVQRRPQSKIISPRVVQSPASAPASSCSLTQGSSPSSLSRYHSSPSVLGITALLHDHDESKVEDATLSSPASPLASLPITRLPKVNSLPAPTMASRSVASSSAQSQQHSRPLASSQLPPSSPKTTYGPVSPLPVAQSPPPPPVPLPQPMHSIYTSGFTCGPSAATSPPPPPPPPPPPSLPLKNLVTASAYPPPPPPPPSCNTCPITNQSTLPPPLPPLSLKNSTTTTGPPLPPPPPLHSGSASGTVPVPPCPVTNNSAVRAPPAPPPGPPAPPPPLSHNGNCNGNIPLPPGPPLGLKGRGLPRTNPKGQSQMRKANLKPYHWLKLTRVVQGSLWAEAQKPDEAAKAPEFDISELESLFSAAAPNSGSGGKGGKSGQRASGPKSEKVQLIELRRANNCEIMLSKIKIPLPDLMSSVLALDESVLDDDQVENLIKFCPAKEEMELLKGYTGDKEKLGRCEKFFLELMKVPRVESKLRVFLFKIQFCSQVYDLTKSLNIINSAAEEVRSSVKLKRIMQSILSLGNALNHGTARGSAVGFRLDSLLKLTDTRSRNNKMTLMHYLCKVLAEKLPELLDFPKDVVSLEAATKIQLKFLAEEMQAISKGLEKVVQELAASENDGPISEQFRKTLREFLCFAEGEVRSLASLYSTVGRNADALALYFGEDPARVPFEQVVSTLMNFVRIFVRSHEENCKRLEFEKKKARKEEEKENLKSGANKGDTKNPNANADAKQ